MMGRRHNVTYIRLTGPAGVSYEGAILNFWIEGATMKRFTDAGRRAIKDDNLYSALSLALTMPDICVPLKIPVPGIKGALHRLV